VLVELADRDLNVRVLSARADVDGGTHRRTRCENAAAVTRKSVASNLVVARGGLAQADFGKHHAAGMIRQSRDHADESRAEAAKSTLPHAAGVQHQRAVQGGRSIAVSATTRASNANVSQGRLN